MLVRRAGELVSIHDVQAYDNNSYHGWDTDFAFLAPRFRAGRETQRGRVPAPQTPRRKPPPASAPAVRRLGPFRNVGSPGLCLQTRPHGKGRMGLAASRWGVLCVLLTEGARRASPRPPQPLRPTTHTYTADHTITPATIRAAPAAGGSGAWCARARAPGPVSAPPSPGGGAAPPPRCLRVGAPAFDVKGSYLVDPASSHMLVSKIKPCMSKYKLLYTVKLRMAH